jgi:hypothetical protein
MLHRPERSARISRGLFAACSLAAACAGGGGDSPTTTVAFDAASSICTEGGGFVSVAIVLRTDRSATAREVRVTVGAAATGSTADALDLPAFAASEIVFPVGSVDGALATIDVEALDDDLVEGASEVFKLELSGPEGAQIGSRRRHTLSILDADSAAIAFASASAATPGEASGAVPVAVELDLAAGAALAVPVSVRIADSLAGSATRNADYQGFAARTLTFPPGSADGALATADVVVVDDTELEGDETVVLALSQASAGSSLGAIDLYTLTITDDEVSAGSFLALSIEGQPAGSLANGATLDFGSRSVGAGSGSEIRVSVKNLGAQSMTMAPPVIHGADERDFSVLLEPAAFAPAAVASAAPLEVDLASLADAAPALAEARLARLVGPSPAAREAAAIELERIDPPIAPGAILAVDGVASSPSPGAWAGDLTLWRARSQRSGAPAGFVATSARGARGWLVDPLTGELVHVLSSRRAAGGFGTHGIAAASIDAAAPVFDCEGALQAPEGSGGGSRASQAAALPRVRLALETDYQLYSRFDDVGALVGYVTALVAAASQRYATDVQVELEIAYLGVHSQPDDGWTTPDSLGSASQMLSEFQQAWGPAYGGSWPASADLAHFLSGAALGGGVAYVGVTCNPDWGFAVSGNLNAFIDWSSWSFASGPLTWDFVVFVHELGHNLGSLHTHSYCPPLDRCASSCSGGSVCSRGTVMSYCHLCAGGMAQIDLEFHPFTANVMREANATSCLGWATLAPSAEAVWSLRFDPSATGPRQAALAFDHTAANEPPAFTLELSGTGSP